MLVLSRHKDESIVIDQEITVTVVDIRVDKVRLGIHAPKDVAIDRQEIYEEKSQSGQYQEHVSLDRKVLEWINGPHTGNSARAMACCAVNLGPGAHRTGREHPHDAGDLWRCFHLVKTIPEIRDHFPRIAQLSPVWAAIIAAWDELHGLYESEAVPDWSSSKRSPRTDRRLQAVIDSASLNAQPSTTLHA